VSRRPSPAFVVALIALFVALGGTGYAVVKVNGKDIVNRSISGKKLKRNTVGGREIAEAKLGRVARAGHADTAARADASNTAVHARVADETLSFGGHNVNAFLLNTDKAANADMLDGLDSTDLIKARGDAQLLDMPASAGVRTQVELATNGPLTMIGECENSAGAPVARVGIRHTDDAFLFVGDGGGTAVSLPGSPGTMETIVDAVSPGGPQWGYQRRDFTAVSNAASGALQGSATAMAISNGGSRQCLLAGWAFAT
jgi:hypothetical protein